VDDQEKRIFRHKGIRDFTVGKFKFKDHVIRVAADDMADFLRAMGGLHPRYRNPIVEINEKALRLSEMQLKANRVVRGAMPVSTAGQAERPRDQGGDPRFPALLNESGSTEDMVLGETEQSDAAPSTSPFAGLNLLKKQMPSAPGNTTSDDS
jgi:hypothetical protein